MTTIDTSIREIKAVLVNEVSKSVWYHSSKSKTLFINKKTGEVTMFFISENTGHKIHHIVAKDYIIMVKEK